MMQLENCSFEGEELSLPGSLRFLSLKCEQAPSDAQLHVLLHACTAIEVGSMLHAFAAPPSFMAPG